jgi:DNA-binding transcriptional regulator LsrR (DeoR family)
VARSLHAFVAEELGTSRATVSRLLSYAMENGLVEIRVHDPQELSGNLESMLREHYTLRSIQAVKRASRKAHYLAGTGHVTQLGC